MFSLSSVAEEVIPFHGHSTVVVVGLRVGFLASFCYPLSCSYLTPPPLAIELMYYIKT